MSKRKRKDVAEELTCLVCRNTVVVKPKKMLELITRTMHIR